MPQHKGFEPFTFLWALQVRVRYKGIGASSYDCADTKMVFFADETSKNNYANFIATGQKSSDPRHIELVRDLGRVKWFNDRLWIVQQMMDVFTNGNFDENLLPIVG